MKDTLKRINDSVVENLHDVNSRYQNIRDLPVRKCAEGRGVDPITNVGAPIIEETQRKFDVMQKRLKRERNVLIIRK